jgi:hypothetical protein
MIHNLKPYPAYKGSDLFPGGMVLNGFVELEIREGKR